MGSRPSKEHGVKFKHFSEISEPAERVVDAAEDLVQRFGYTGFSYDDVARLVGIKKPGIHHHFPRKEELVVVVAQRYTHRFREELLAIEGRYQSPVDRLLAYTELFERTYRQDQKLCLCGMLGAEMASLPDSVAVEVNRFFSVNLSWLAEVIERGQAEGKIIDSQNANALAEACLSILEGAMIVGRGVGSVPGPAQVGAIFISSIST
ncbi:TetR family transcriptional regulator [Burkholderia sp. Nafp2/4-1b]|nr:TetR family transcriptional regulator [Burkholderia sp. Nafp2/4-1b]